MTSNPDVVIVMPAYNAAHLLPRTVPAALAIAGPGNLLVVDPASTDDTSEVARSLGARVLRLPERGGPATARNAGVQHTESELVLFIDADCVAHPDVVQRVRSAFEDPAVISVMGSYDDTPPEQNFFSLYMNLRHHYTHQRGNREHAGFWGGCGAVRRKAFLESGGFDEQRFPLPMIEDIEIGLRLAPLGVMRLDPDMHVTHLKRWTMRTVIETDIKCRAIPWTRLILETGKLPNDLNLRLGQRIAAALAPLVLVGLPLGAVSWLLGLRLVGLGLLLPAAASLALHTDLLGFFTRKRGLWFALRFWLFHQVHLTYSAATFAVLSLTHERSHAGRPQAQ